MMRGEAVFISGNGVGETGPYYSLHTFRAALLSNLLVMVRLWPFAASPLSP